MSNELNAKEMEGFCKGKLGHLQATVRAIASAAAESGADSAEMTLAAFGGDGNEPQLDEYVPYVKIGVRRPSAD